ncbi:hypothetical protein [Paracidobacterium acidisoli]|uniref:AsmA-like C-terminal domain-containing protein n=1 Tax=Paracidobacterium acidisoli TaxID=2303751 RepID=A0A372IM02_9BACT|nr:hypothetical protein [Paracidobacterium acidisoli]MBT9332489.1 hypothetical protein [Paracidobacterium acidisoli]
MRRVLYWVGGIVLLALIAVLIVAEILLHRAEPILKAHVVDALSQRFDSRVELERFDVSVLRGFEVTGGGLKLYPNQLDMQQPLFAVEKFSFHVHWRGLLENPLHIARVQLEGLAIQMPPKNQRKNVPHPEGNGSGKHVSIFVDEIQVNKASLVMRPGKPGKIPLEFDISSLTLDSIGAGQPMKFHAILVNPKPVGDINTTGYFGPFSADSPGDTPVRGSYEFRNADLSTLKGIGGILSSDGKYEGTLNHIAVDGETKTPDFRIDIANHPMPLNTTFHAVVDGTNGDTHLQPVDAWLGHSHILAKGDVVRVPGKQGHDILLDVTVTPGTIQDMLQLAVKTVPPVMTGALTMHTKLRIPPGDLAVPDKLQLNGSFRIEQVHFTNDKVQEKVDELSLRGQGRAKEAEREGKADKDDDPDNNVAANVASDMSGDFMLDSARLMITNLNYDVPGAQIALDGIYSLDGAQFDFHGKARLQAKVSQLVTGWKSLLLKPVDPFFSKHGAGTEVPIKVTGTKSEPHFGLDFGHNANPGTEKSH